MTGSIFGKIECLETTLEIGEFAGRHAYSKSRMAGAANDKIADVAAIIAGTLVDDKNAFGDTFFNLDRWDAGIRYNRKTTICQNIRVCGIQTTFARIAQLCRGRIKTACIVRRHTTSHFRDLDSDFQIFTCCDC